MTPQQTPYPHDFGRLVGLLLEGELAETDRRRLEQRLMADDAALAYYEDYLEIHSLLHWHHGLPEQDHVEAQLPVMPAVSPRCGSPALPLFAAAAPTSPGFFASDWPAAYLIAAAICGIGLTIGAITYVSPATPWTSHSPRPPQQVTPTASNSTSPVVGRISGMVDCVWEGTRLRGQGSGAANQKSQITNQKSLIHLGDRLTLKSGLLEIAYDTGARVILQGPVAYDVESPVGGYLSLGKLTASLEKRAEVKGQGADPANQKSELIKQKFVVRTPTAVVTDLGTEFAVEVDRSGRTQSHVFRGSVCVAVGAGPGIPSGRRVVLHENQSASIDVGGKTPRISRETPSAWRTWIRALPSPYPVLADLRADYDRHHPTDAEPGKDRILDTLGTGTWSFFASHTENPAARDADLLPLAYTTKADGLRNGDCYATPGQPWGLPGVKNGQLIADAPWLIAQDEHEGIPPEKLLVAHPGHDKSHRPYLVVRWRAGEGEEGPARVRGVIRDLGSVADGITFAVYADGVERFPSRIVALYGGPYFDLRCDVHRHTCIDLVIGCNGNWNSDQSALSITIFPESGAKPQQNGSATPPLEAK